MAVESLEDKKTEGTDRQVPSVAKRVLIIGLDGATFDVLHPLIAGGRMPNLKRIIDQGVSGILHSTKPPITPAAWTTFMTGKGPGRHGIIDFERYDVRRNTLTFNSTERIQEKTIWQLLSEKGLRVGSINLPMTYPPRKVNGFMISGFETPSVDANFTYPDKLKDEILERWPDYTYRTKWQRKAFGGIKLFQQNLQYISRSFVQGLELTTHCGEKFGWDVLMVLFKLVDNLQHKAWKYLDPKTAGQDPRRAALAADCFKDLDDVLGSLLEYAKKQEAVTVIMSDHGHGSLEGKAQPNLLLKKWGYLELTSRWSQSRIRGAYMLERMFRKKNGRFAANHGVEHDLAIDWSKTQACVVHAGIYGFLYLNLKGRQPDGVVEPEDYERLRAEIRDRLLAETCHHPNGQTIHIFPEVHKTEELYHCSREDHEWMPDLLLVPDEGLAVVRKIRGFSSVRWCPQGRMEGTHRVKGIMAIHGPNVRRGAKMDGNIADITPTLLAILGLAIPVDMEGRVLEDAFSPAPTIRFEPPQKREEVSEEEIYTEAEKEALTERLTDLGYLE